MVFCFTFSWGCTFSLVFVIANSFSLALNPLVFRRGKGWNFSSHVELWSKQSHWGILCCTLFYVAPFETNTLLWILRILHCFCLFYSLHGFLKKSTAMPDGENISHLALDSEFIISWCESLVLFLSAPELTVTQEASLGERNSCWGPSVVTSGVRICGGLLLVHFCETTLRCSFLFSLKKTRTKILYSGCSLVNWLEYMGLLCADRFECVIF